MMVDRVTNRAAIIAEAKRWVGTPFLHQAAVKGVGCDCLGLVRGVWQTVSKASISLAPYAQNWAEKGGSEILHDGLLAHGVKIDPSQSRPGDVVLFRFRADYPCSHVGLIMPNAKLIHARTGHGVREEPFTRALKKYWVASYILTLETSL